MRFRTSRLTLATPMVLAALPVERFAEGEPVKLIPPGKGFEHITEAVTTEFCALMDLVRQAVRDSARMMPGCNDCYVDMRGIWADHAVVQLNGRLWSFPYTVAADNTIRNIVRMHMTDLGRSWYDPNSQVRVASVDRHLAELIPLFGSSGHHHIPIVDAEDRLVGIVTQSDVVAALSQPHVTNPGPA